MRARRALSPRGAASASAEDLAEKGWLVATQRVSPFRLRRRIARRARRLLTRAGLVVVGLGVLGGAGLLGAWLLASPRFAVADIEVRGQSRIGVEEILAAADIVPGVSLWRVDPRAVAARLEALPLVRRAEVIRAWPNRITLLVEERRPFTLVHAGRLHWIDEQGMALGGERRAVAPTLPVLSGLAPADLEAQRAGQSERVATGISLLRILLRSGSALLTEISEIDVSRTDGPVLYTVEGIEVRLGADDWEARLGRLLGVLGQVRTAKEAVTAIDLRFRDQIVLKTAAR